MVSLRPHLAGLTAALVLALAGPRVVAAPAAGDAPLLQRWLDAQSGIKTWSAEFVQTRSLKSLVQPLTATGQVWFEAPERFRWELGRPAQTIAVRQPAQVLVLYPRLKRAEKYPLDNQHPGPWKDALALLEAGFPRSRPELEARFKILSETLTNDVCEIHLQPRSPGARKLMPRITISFATNDLALRATELQFADGSRMRNDFREALVNPVLATNLFAPVIEADWKVEEPAKR